MCANQIGQLLFNTIECGSLPKEWQTFVVTLVFKKRDKIDPKKYQPINLLDIYLDLKGFKSIDNLLCMILYSGNMLQRFCR